MAWRINTLARKDLSVPVVGMATAAARGPSSLVQSGSGPGDRTFRRAFLGSYTRRSECKVAIRQQDVGLANLSVLPSQQFLYPFRGQAVISASVTSPTKWANKTQNRVSKTFLPHPARATWQSRSVLGRIRMVPRGVRDEGGESAGGEDGPRERESGRGKQTQAELLMASTNVSTLSRGLRAQLAVPFKFDVFSLCPVLIFSFWGGNSK